MIRNKIRYILLAVCSIFILSGCDGEQMIFEISDTSPGTYGQSTEEGKSQQNLQHIMVHVCGAVHSPGVISLSEDARVIDAINMAGGMTPEADGTYVNLAAFLTDGEKVYVPTVEEVLLWEIQQGQEIQVNINQADEVKLCTLPGIGESKARDIIAYREKNGDFQTIEDIMKVPGIKDSLFQKIKDFIAVK